LVDLRLVNLCTPEAPVPCEGGVFFDRHPGLKPQAES
jgi:hypothetical protein